MAECLPVSLAEKADCGNFHWKPTGKLKYKEKYKAGHSSSAAHRTDSCCWALHASAAESEEGHQNVIRVSCIYNDIKAGSFPDVGKEWKKGCVGIYWTKV